MKCFITPNTQSPTNYALVIKHDDGHEEVKMIEKITNDAKSYILPENPSNRHFWAISRVKDEPIELTYKESKTFGPRDNQSPRKKLEDYLTDEEKSIISKIMEECKKRREADKPKPLTEVEKAKREYEKFKAKYEALLAKESEVK